MRLKAYLIIFFSLAVIAAPIVDAIACDGCKDIIPLRDMSLSIATESDHLACQESLPDACASDPQSAETAPDLCPVCANCAVALSSAFCGDLSVTGYAYHLPKLLAFADPFYSITKPPEK